MKFTYEAIQTWIIDYFKSLNSMDSNTDKMILRDKFHPHLKMNTGVSPAILNREQWVDHLRVRAGQCRTKMTYEQEPYGIHIDVRTGRAFMTVYEESLDHETGESLKPGNYLCMIWEFKALDNTIKAHRGVIVKTTELLVKGSPLINNSSK